MFAPLLPGGDVDAVPSSMGWPICGPGRLAAGQSVSLTVVVQASVGPTGTIDAEVKAGWACAGPGMCTADATSKTSVVVSPPG